MWKWYFCSTIAVHCQHISRQHNTSTGREPLHKREKHKCQCFLWLLPWLLHEWYADINIHNLADYFFCIFTFTGWFDGGDTAGNKCRDRRVMVCTGSLVSCSYCVWHVFEPLGLQDAPQPSFYMYSYISGHWISHIKQPCEFWFCKDTESQHILGKYFSFNHITLNLKRKWCNSVENWNQAWLHVSILHHYF